MNPQDNMTQAFRVPVAAKHYGIGRTTLWRWIKEGKLKVSRPTTGLTLIKKSDIEALLFGEA